MSAPVVSVVVLIGISIALAALRNGARAFVKFVSL